MEKKSNNFLIVNHGHILSYNFVLALQEANLLKTFITSYYKGKNKFFDIIFGAKAERRYLPGIKKKYVKNFLFSDILYLIIKKFSNNGYFLNYSIRFRSLILQYISIFYLIFFKYDYLVSWESNSYFLFKYAFKKKKIKKILIFGHIFLPYEIELLKNDRIINPEVSNSYKIYENNKFIEKIKKEIQYSDYIIVSSTFGKQSLLKYGINKNKIFVNTLGYDAKFQKIINNNNINKPLNILFVGGVSQRKGIKFVFQALSKFSNNKYILHIVGPSKINLDIFDKYSVNYKYYGQVNQRELFEIYSQCNIFLLPSILEGFGIVILEAMASGLVVITSENSCAPDVIENGVDGFFTNVGNINEISKIIQKLLNDFNLIDSIGKKAKIKSKKMTWENYRNDLINRTIINL